MDQRNPSDDKRRAIEGLLGPQGSEENPELPDDYSVTGIGTTSRPPPARRRGISVGAAALIALVIIIIGLIVAVLILAKDQVFALLGGGGDQHALVRELRDEIQELRASVAAQPTAEPVEVENLRQANEALRATVEEQSEQIRQLQDELGELHDRATSPQPADGDESDAALRSRLQEALRRAEALERENTTLRHVSRQQEAAELELELLRNDNQSLREELNSLRTQLGNAESRLSDLAASSAGDRSSSEQLEEINSEYRRVLALLQELRTSNQEKDRRIEELSDENAVLRQRLASTGQTSEELAAAGRTSTQPSRRSAEVTGPTPIEIVRPEYPLSAQRRRVSGIVVVRVLVGEEGAVLEAEVLSSPDPLGSLDRAALEAARRWRFEPARSDGATLRYWYEIPFEFAGRNQE